MVRSTFWLWAIAPAPSIGVECREILSCEVGGAVLVLGLDARRLKIDLRQLAEPIREHRLVGITREEAMAMLEPDRRLRLMA